MTQQNRATLLALADRLQDARKAAGLSYGELAERSGVSKAHVWQLARGRVSNPTISMTEKLAAALNCAPDWLAGWRDASALEKALVRARSDFHLISLHSTMPSMWEDAKAGRERVQAALRATASSLTEPCSPTPITGDRT